MTENQSRSFFNLEVIWEMTKTIAGILVFVFLFRYFILQPYLVVGSSMEPDFHNNDYLFVKELTYKFTNPQRGDVIVFRHPTEECTAYVESHSILRNIFEGPCQSYIKRVIGLPGETVEVKNGKVTIFNAENPSGKTLDESYIEPGVKTLGNLRTTLTNKQYFVLGDNRQPNASSDSREWGPLTKDYIVGKSFVRLLPINTFGFTTRAKY